MVFMEFETKMLSASDDDIKLAGRLLAEGKVVGIPTETVYGLAANALDPAAVSDIFKAKGRPQDNPLIVHIAEFEDIYKYVTEVPENALKLAKAFWPGPMTMVLPKKDIIPLVTSGGLDTVGIRFPVHPCEDDNKGKRMSSCGSLRKPVGQPQPNHCKARYGRHEGQNIRHC